MNDLIFEQCLNAKNENDEVKPIQKQEFQKQFYYNKEQNEMKNAFTTQS